VSTLAGFENWLTPTSAKAARRLRGGPTAPPVFQPPMTVPPGEGGVPRVPPGIPGGFPGPVPMKPPIEPIMPGGVPGPIQAKTFQPDYGMPGGVPGPVPAHELLGHAARQHALGQLALFQQAAPIVNDRQLHDLLATPGDPLQKYPLVYARLHQLAVAAGAPDVIAWLHSLVNGRL
jgi:hypothetical protein